MQIPHRVPIVAPTQSSMLVYPEWRRVRQPIRRLVNRWERRNTRGKEVLFNRDRLRKWILVVAVPANTSARREMIPSDYSCAHTASTF